MKPTYIGAVPVFGELGKPPIGKDFVERLGELPPTMRRLALARACAFPWRGNVAELPHCYRRELESATWEAQEEQRWAARDSRPADATSVLEAEEPPISEVFLRQLIPLGPCERRAQLAQACIAAWILDRTPPPDWLSHYSANAFYAEGEEYRLRKETR